MKRPLLVIVIGYIIGIIWGLYFKINIVPVFLFIIISILLKNKKDKRKVVLIILVVIIISSMRIQYIENKNNKFFNNLNNVEFVGIVTNKNDEEYEVKLKTCNAKILLKAEKELEYADLIYFKGKFTLAEGQKNYKGFDYRLYLKTKNIYGRVKATNIKVLANNKLSFIETLSYNTKQKVQENIYKILPQQEASILIGMLIGQKDNISDETINNFQTTNLSHILAISGLHISYIIIAIGLVIKKIKINVNYGNIFTILFLLFYMFIVDFSESAVRAIIMAIIYLISKLIHEKNDFLNSISLALLITLVLNPYKLFSIGLQLSYIATLGIVYISPHFNNKYLKKLSVPLAAQISILPITIINFKNFSLYFLISNLISAPLIIIIIIFGFLISIISLISIELSIVLVIPLKYIIQLLNLIVIFISKLPFASILTKTPHEFSIVIFYIVLAVLLKMPKIVKKKLIIKCIIVIVILNQALTLAIDIPKDFKICFIDVSQGDSTLIVTKTNKKILIDGGGNDYGTYDIGERILLPYLLSRRINEIDYMIISHFDSDHAKGAISLLKRIDVKNIIIGKQFIENENLEEMIIIAKEEKINLIIVEAGDKMQFDKSTSMQVLWPDTENVINENVINNNSLVFKLNYKNFSMLFTGDIEAEAERAILKKYNNRLKADILKVAHHGSKSSTTDEFLKSVSPQYAIIGVGKNNTFGHPSINVIESLNKYNCKVYRTDIDNEIIISISKRNIKVST